MAKKLKFYTLAALDQRVSLKIRLLPFSLSETAGYIKHHLSFCGRTDNLFSDDAASLIHNFLKSSNVELF
ncbi:MAG: hypothetical protein IBX64_09765 [Actinobacteria bacterium]|nr:hypothetical protein [Actinomycetota bacterium]